MQGVGLRSLKEAIDTDSSIGVFHIFGALTEFERALISERMQAGSWQRAPGDALGAAQAAREGAAPPHGGAVPVVAAHVDEICALVGVSLEDLIQTVANFEAAHSVSTSRLATFGDEEPTKARRNPAPHILNAVTFGGVRYAHLVVIESAMYLYEALVDKKSVTRPKGDIYGMKLGFACDADQSQSETPNWASFAGTMMVAFRNAPKVTRHEIRPVGKG